MKIPHTITVQNHKAWEVWVIENIGVLNVDYFMVPEKYVIDYPGGGRSEGYNPFWEIPDSKKAMLWALKWL